MCYTIIAFIVFFTVLHKGLKEGGYIASLGPSRESSLATLDYLREKHWLDRWTVGVALEFAMYSADVNLATLVLVSWQFPVGGGSQVEVHVDSIRLYESKTNAIYAFTLTFFAVFFLFTIGMMIMEVKRLTEHRLRYLLTIASLFHLSSCVLSMSVVVLYGLLYIEVDDLIDAYNAREEFIGHFQSVTNLNVLLNNMFGILLFVGMFKFVHLLRLNLFAWHYFSILKRARSRLLGCLIFIGILFMGFALFFHLVADKNLQSFSTLGRCLLVLFQGFNGNINMEELREIHVFFGPFFFLACLVVTYMVGLNLATSVYIGTAKYIRKYPVVNQDNQILWLLIYRFLKFCGIKKQNLADIL